jgi:hypothetical protein
VRDEFVDEVAWRGVAFAAGGQMAGECQRDGAVRECLQEGRQAFGVAVGEPARALLGDAT